MIIRTEAPTPSITLGFFSEKLTKKKKLTAQPNGKMGKIPDPPLNRSIHENTKETKDVDPI